MEKVYKAEMIEGDMFGMNKRGDVSTPATILKWALIVFVVIVVGSTFIGTFFQGNNFVVSLGENMANTASGFANFFEPVLKGLLNLRGGDDVEFLMIVTFILVFMIISSTLDTFQLFGDNDSFSSRSLNFVAGVIVSAIGVRFLPSNMWLALTVPSSAFVATILAGIVFIPLAMLTVASKKNPLFIKLGWLGYIVMFSYIIITATERVVPQSAIIAYVVFIFLAVIMLFFDGAVRKFYFVQKESYSVRGTLDDTKLLQRVQTKTKINEIQALKTDADPADIPDLDNQIKALKKKLLDDFT